MLLVIILPNADAFTTMSDYTQIPPFLVREVPSNVVIAMDISGSMKAVAYRDTGAGNWKTGMHDDYNPDISYYGYFNSTDKYIYDSNKEFFKVDNVFGQWDGNFMSWLCMRRIDIARKVMVGGKVSVKMNPEPFIDSNGNEIWDEGESFTDDNNNGIWNEGNYNRNRVPYEHDDWTSHGWDGWYILEGQHEPEDYIFTKRYDKSKTNGLATLFENNQIFLISEQEIVTGENVVALCSEVEIGEISVGANRVWVPFKNSYNQPRVVIKSATYEEKSPIGDPRITWKTGKGWPHNNATGFYVELQKWKYLGGKHGQETVAYIVVESANGAGTHRGWINVPMADGDVWKFMAQKSEIKAEQNECGCDHWQTVNFDAKSSHVPIVFSGISKNGSDPVVVRNKDINKTGMKITFQEQEKDDGKTSCEHYSEIFYLILVDPPGGAKSNVISDTINVDGNDYMIQGGLINKVSHAMTNTKWNPDFDNEPAILCDMQTTNGPDPANIRIAQNTTKKFKITITEEKSEDNEINHDLVGHNKVWEDVGWIAMGISRRSFKIRIGVETEPTGIIQSVSDSMRIGLAVYNYNHSRDPTKIYTGNTVHGGTLYPCYPDLSLDPHLRTNEDICIPCGVKHPVKNIIQVIEEHPLIWGTTPIAETLYEIYGYCAQIDHTSSRGHPQFYDNKYSKNSYEINNDWDPYYYDEFGEKVWCAKTFVLHFNDGEPYKDWDGNAGNHPLSIGDYDNDGNSGPQDQLDDLALYIRENDIRSDMEPDTHQEIISYYVYAALGEGEINNSSTRKMREAAANGGFMDFDGDHKPDPAHPSNFINYYKTYFNGGNCETNEWDLDGDCNPDTFYYANNGYELENQLLAAFQGILKRASSGTAASVISQSRSGEGAVYQSIFFPRYNDFFANEVSWCGQVHALFVDAYGNMREDTNKNKRLDLSDDKIIVLDGTILKKYGDDNGDSKISGEEEATDEIGTIANIEYLFNSNDWLNEISDNDIIEQREYANNNQKRYIFTFIDANNDMIVDSDEQKPFTCDSIPSIFDLKKETEIYPYIPVYPPFNPPPYVPHSNADFKDFLRHQTKRVINYIRGEDQESYIGTGYIIPPFRSRQIDYDDDGNVETWRLGDIIYSTPTVVGRPGENYHLIYRDFSYAEFCAKYMRRRGVVYVGANDGMFHAFNAGFYDHENMEFLTRPSDLNAEDDFDFDIPLGAELWAYVPYNLLPHLYWLTDPNYSHVYYCDLKPKIFDAKIFPPDDDHPEGWGTLLVAGMRFGGGEIYADMDKTDGSYNQNKDRIMTSAYFILDITNPEIEPTVLAEISFKGLGYTTCYPTVIPMKDKDEDGNISANNWYLVIGSGPADQFGKAGTGTALKNAISAQPANLYVIDLVKLATDHELWTLDNSGILTEGENVFQTLDSNSFISDPISVDYNIDYNTDALYFGTISGNAVSGWGGKLRRVVIDNNLSTSDWKRNNVLIDLTGVENGQPITTASSIGVDHLGNKWIFFGTGRFFVGNDACNNDQQTYYGIKEPTDEDGKLTWNTVSRSDLIDVSSANVFTSKKVIGVVGVNSWDDLTNRIDENNGWYINFSISNEKNLGQATLLGELLTFTTFMPSLDPCSFEGESKLYALYYTTGTAFYETVIGKKVSEDEPILKGINLGKGLAVTPNIHVGREEGTKAFIQTSTGDIKIIHQITHGRTKSGRIFWRYVE